MSGIFFTPVQFHECVYLEFVCQMTGRFKKEGGKQAYGYNVNDASP